MYLNIFERKHQSQTLGCKTMPPILHANKYIIFLDSENIFLFMALTLIWVLDLLEREGGPKGHL